uniref:Anion exchange protein n=1 Tax=Globodera rostochiensis TaxID=31243 RepID=A0A914H4V0_GLORO
MSSFSATTEGARQQPTGRDIGGEDAESAEPPPFIIDVPSGNTLSAQQKEKDAADRRESLWISMGIHRADETGQSIRKRRMSRNRESLELQQTPQLSTAQRMEDLAPGTRVMFLLNEQDDSPAVFTEMGELWRSGDVEEWRETARWVKFEEDVEEGGNRWSKPHVATLSLHALFQLRSCLLHGIVLIDLEAATLPELIERILEQFVANGDLQESECNDVRYVLSRRHTHQYEQARHSAAANGGSSQGSFLSAVRSISDIGRTFSHGKNLQGRGTDSDSPSKRQTTGNQLELPKVGSLPKDMQKESSQSSEFFARNVHFMKKLPPGAEASNVLVGEVDFLNHHVTAFVRLKKAQLLGDLTEVPFKEIGRAIATLMSDEIFHEVAYKAKQRSDLLDGVDEFLDAVTVLPPGEWDPNIRIEPPSSIPNQQNRVQAQKGLLSVVDKGGNGKAKGGGGANVGGVGGAGEKNGASTAFIMNGKKTSLEDEDGAGHGQDPALRRTGKLFGGLIADIRRRAPHFRSDFADALNLQCVASFCFMYFALLAPIVTFGGLLEEATHQRMAAMENLASGAICGIIYHLFSGQPLTIIGSTGPVLVFETIIFDMCTSMSIDYLSFRFWVHVWTALILFLMVATDASSLVSYITRFTEESFAMLIAVIFIYEACMKLLKINDSLEVISYMPPRLSPASPLDQCRCVSADASMAQVGARAHKLQLDALLPPSNSTAPMDYSQVPLGKCTQLLGRLEGTSCFVLYDQILMSLVLMLSTFFLATTLKKLRNSCYFPSKVRQVLSDFAVMIAIVCLTLLDFCVGINTPKLNVPSTFRPTWSGRGWLIAPFNGNPIWTAPLALIPALLACVLIFMDQQITAVIVNRRENKLKKGCGYHLDLLVLSLLIIIVGVLGLPIYVAATILSINHVNSLRVESESRAPGERTHFIGCREQRVTGIVTFTLIGLSVTMTKLLKFIPMPVLYGVFLFMGISALDGIQLFDRILLMLMPMKYQPDTIYIRHVPIRVIHKFTLFQVACLAILWTIKSIKSTSIAFAIMLVVMVAVRKAMERCFSEKDLKYLDDKMPDFHLRRREDKEKRESQGQAVEIDLDENQGTIRAVKTEAHLHIPMSSGNVIKIPLAAIQEPSRDININISKEVTATGMWRSITSESRSSLQQKQSGCENPAQRVEKDAVKQTVGELRLATPEEDDDQAITITAGSAKSAEGAESQPLLQHQKDEASTCQGQAASPV